MISKLQFNQYLQDLLLSPYFTLLLLIFLFIIMLFVIRYLDPQTFDWEIYDDEYEDEEEDEEEDEDMDDEYDDVRGDKYIEIPVDFSGKIDISEFIELITEELKSNEFYLVLLPEDNNFMRLGKNNLVFSPILYLVPNFECDNLNFSSLYDSVSSLKLALESRILLSDFYCNFNIDTKDNEDYELPLVLQCTKLDTLEKSRLIINYNS